MGVCNGEAVGGEAAFGIGEGGDEAGGCAQGTGPRQHDMGVCNGEAVGLAAVYGIGEGGNEVGGRVQSTGPCR